MSDRRLREAERRYQETGSIADEAAWLRERLRVGSISYERMTLAAFSDHPAAVRVLGDNAPSQIDRLETWSATLAQTHAAWRPVGWLLSGALHYVLEAWVGPLYLLSEQHSAHGLMPVVSRVVNVLQLAADSGYEDLLGDLLSPLESLVEQSAARELIWDGPVHGWPAHIALRSIETIQLRRYNYAGTVADLCAQAKTRVARGWTDRLTDARADLLAGLKRRMVERALGTKGPLRGYPHTPTSHNAFVISCGKDGLDRIKEILGKETV